MYLTVLCSRPYLVVTHLHQKRKTIYLFR